MDNKRLINVVANLKKKFKQTKKDLLKEELCKLCEAGTSCSRRNYAKSIGEPVLYCDKFKKKNVR